MTAVLTTPIKIKKKNNLSYFREVQQELGKVSWTSKEEIRFCTKVVVGSTFVFGLGIYLIDLVLRGALDLVFLIGKLIGG